MKQPTKEELAAASSVVTIKFVAAKDGRPATPEEIARGNTSEGSAARLTAPPGHQRATSGVLCVDASHLSHRCQKGYKSAC